MTTSKRYDITPVPKPRMTQKDKRRRGVQPRPPVARYNAFKQEVQLKIKDVDLNQHLVVFHMPMPKSWSEAKRAEMAGTPHTQKPDLDNLFKALGDAMHIDDSHIHQMCASKLWDYEPGIDTLRVKGMQVEALS